MTRRTFMHVVASSLAAASAPSFAEATRTRQRKAGPRPNIVIILADDLGFSDIGCYGAEIHTPNLDRLAAEGLRFTQGYSAARCCPSRASLLTGLYPHQTGMGGMVTPPDRPKPPGPYQGYLNDRCVTLAEVLREAGYRTYMSGKWHVGEAPQYWPRKRGFDRYFGLISGASSYFELLDKEPRKRVMALDDDSFTPTGDKFYMTDAFTDFAVQCLENHGRSETPFLLYLAYTAPHWPLHAWPEDIAKYKDRYHIGWDVLREQRHKRQIELGVVDPKWPLSPRDEEVPPWDSVPNKDDWALRMAVYAAMVDRMDQGIGRVLDALRRIGAEENTLVMFLSDNGACHEGVEGRKLHERGTFPGERGSFVAYERPWGNAGNTPFRLFKHWVHEGGIATPLIARWPAVITNGGGIADDVVHVIDIMPTCVDMAGAEYPTSHNGQPILPFEGRSMVPILSGGRRPRTRTLFWEHQTNAAVRDGDWKLVSREAGRWELYNLVEDRTELHDRAQEKPRKVRLLQAKYDAWAERCGVASQERAIG